MKNNKLFKGLQTLFYVLRVLFFIMLMVLPLTWYCMLLKRKKTIRKEFSTASKIILWALGVKLKIQGEIPKKDERYIIVANHSSFIDVFIIPVYFNGEPGTAIVDKKMFGYPVLGYWLKQNNIIGFDRKNTSDRKKVVLEMEKVLREDRLHLFLFPEGTRTSTGEMGEFQRSAFELAKKYQKNILPLSIVGAFEVSSKKSPFLTPGSVYVINQKLINSKDIEPKQLSSITREEIQDQITKAKSEYSQKRSL